MSGGSQEQPNGATTNQHAERASKAPSDDITKKVKDFSDLASSCLGLLLKVSVPFGGPILLIYAAKEGFCYDTSSIAAISVLVFVLSAFVALTLFMLLYGAVMSVWRNVSTTLIHPGSEFKLC